MRGTAVGKADVLTTDDKLDTYVGVIFINDAVVISTDFRVKDVALNTLLATVEVWSEFVGGKCEEANESSRKTKHNDIISLHVDTCIN